MAATGSRFYVYMYRHPDKKYPVWIGKGRDKRAWDHLTDAHNKAFHDFLNKYPHTRPEFIHDGLTEEQALDLEAALIKKYGRRFDNSGTLFNISEGGQNELPTKTAIKFRGKDYESKSALARDYNVEPQKFLSRLNNKWAVEEALGLRPRQNNPVAVNRLQFRSRAEAARHFSKDPALVSKRVAEGWSLEQALELEDRDVRSHPNQERITFKGKKFKSLAALARAYDVPPNIFHHRYRAGWTVPEALGLDPRKRINPGNRGKPVACDGRIFPTVKAFSLFYKLDYQEAIRHLHIGWPPRLR